MLDLARTGNAVIVPSGAPEGRAALNSAGLT
jgi:hypothetical protein